MSDNQGLPGLETIPSDIHVIDQEKFLKSIPELLTNLRMRVPQNASKLNLSVDSLVLIDQYLDTEIENILANGRKVTEALDRDLLRETMAYVGEVLARNLNGYWEMSHRIDTGGPVIIVPLQAPETELRSFRAVEICSKVLRTVIEGESIGEMYRETMSQISA